MPEGKEAYQIVEISQESEKNKNLQRSATSPKMEFFPLWDLRPSVNSRVAVEWAMFLTNTILQ